MMGILLSTHCTKQQHSMLMLVKGMNLTMHSSLYHGRASEKKEGEEESKGWKGHRN